MLERNTPMKRLTGLVLTLCVLLAAAGCSGDTEIITDSTSDASLQTTSAATAESSSKTEATVQTAESTTTTNTMSENPNDDVPVEKEVQILELNERTTFEYRWSEDTAMPLVECECASVVLGGEDSDRFSTLAAVLMDAADAEESSLKEEYKMFSETVDEMIGMGMELQTPLASKFDAQVRRADNIVLSVLTDCHYDNGMNGGHRSFWGSNYDTQTGEELHLPDIVTDMEAFTQAVEDRLFGTVGADVFYNDGIIKEYFDMYGADGTHWSIDYNGVTVYFGEGEIADIGIGGMNVTITFAERPDLFDDKYKAVPDAYIVSLPMKYTFYTDLDGDGSCEELSIYDRYDEENAYEAAVDIYIGDASYSESLWAYDCKPYYVKTSDDKHYLYLFAELETQMYLYVYDITGGTVIKVGEASVSPFYNDGISAVLTDPDRMHFDIFTDEAGGGVSAGDDIFVVGADGMPMQFSSVYHTN